MSDLDEKHDCLVNETSWVRELNKLRLENEPAEEQIYCSWKEKTETTQLN